MATPEQIRGWLNANPGASDAQIFQAMQQNGVTPEQLQAVTGGDLGGIQSRYRSAGNANTDNQIRDWLGRNQGASDADIYRAMQANGISPDMVARATGGDAGKIGARYATQQQVATTGRAGATGPGANPMQIPTGLYGSEQALGAGYESALTSLLAGIGQGRADVTQYGNQALDQVRGGFNRAEGYMDPYVQQGKTVNPLLMALTGASGQDAFNKAFTESPVQQFLQERGNRAIAANAAATGGLGGANVQKEFMRYNQGLAGQGLQDQINNLMGLSNQGFAGASNAAGFAGQSGQAQAGISQNMGQSLANMALTGGMGAGGYAMSTGQQVANGRSQAGRDLANAISATSSNLSTIARNQGTDVSGIYDTLSGNLADLLSNRGINQAELYRWLAGAQANGAQNASGQLAGVPGTSLMPTNNLQSVAQLLGGAGTMIGAMNPNNLRAL